MPYTPPLTTGIIAGSELTLQLGSELNLLLGLGLNLYDLLRTAVSGNRTQE